MAIFYADININIHEVLLKDKPTAMLEASSKGTVPVLCIDDHVIDESLDIMYWALSMNDPDAWLNEYSAQETELANALIAKNDLNFKPWLDKYKYANRHPEFPQQYYRQQCDVFLLQLEAILEQQPFLISKDMTFTDVAIFPFIRQFSMVNVQWFNQCHLSNLRTWLNHILSTDLFKRVFLKLEK
jgi:glutathione S-transferase